MSAEKVRVDIVDYMGTLVGDLTMDQATEVLESLGTEGLTVSLAAFINIPAGAFADFVALVPR